MKIDSKALFKFVTLCAYFCLAVVGGGFIAYPVNATIDILTDDKPHWTVALNNSAIENTISPVFNDSNETEAVATVKAVEMEIPVKEPTITLMLIYLSAICSSSLIIIAIIYHLQKIFKSDIVRLDFQPETIRRMKLIALWLALYVPVMWIGRVADYGIMYVNGYQEYYAMPFNFSVKALRHTMDVPMLIGAAVICLIAEMFNYGLRLEQENKEFV